MNYILLPIVMSIALMPSLATSAVDNSVPAAPTICEGKNSAESHIKTLSDFELARGIANILVDPRVSHFRSARTIKVWIQEQSDCAVWTKGIYFIELKWLYREAVARGLTSTINKLAQGVVRWNPTQENFEERKGSGWIPWNAYLK